MRRNDLVEHKGFVLAYLFSAGLSLVVVVAALVVAVYAVRPIKQQAATAIQTVVQNAVRAAVPEPVQASIEELLTIHANEPANLTASQWKSVRQLLHAWHQQYERFDNLTYAAGERAGLVSSRFGGFVFSNYSDLPQQTKMDWKAFKSLSIPDFRGGWDNNEMIRIEQQFIDSTLTISEVKTILNSPNRYEAERVYIIRSSDYIDRIMPVLIRLGLNMSSVTAVVPTDPQQDLPTFARSFISGLPFTYPPPPLPRVTLTMEQVVQQAAQPPLSTGSSSEERASK